MIAQITNPSAYVVFNIAKLLGNSNNPFISFINWRESKEFQASEIHRYPFNKRESKPQNHKKL